MRPTALGSLTAATVLVFAALALVVPPASATVIEVPDDEIDIAAGIAAASPGDTVMVTCGTYYEHGLVISSAITLTSATHNWGCVTIDGEATDTILTLDDASGAAIHGINFTNGAALFAAGVYVDSCDVEFLDCRFYNNNAEVEGGGLRYRYGNPNISYCDFVSNNASDRGGNLVLYGTGGYVMHCQLSGGMAEWGGGACVRGEATTEFQFCQFTSNEAAGDEGYGGGFYCGNQAAPRLLWCTFTQNTSGLCGGGAASDGNCLPVFTNCTFTENTAQWGGGLFAREPLAGTVYECSFTRNEALGGGGVMIESASNLPISDCWFEGNVATEAGGGVLLEGCSEGQGAFGSTFTGNTAQYGGGLAAHDCTSAEIAGRCTFVLNEVSGARGSGGGIAIRGGDPTSIEKCIIAFSTQGAAVYCEEGAAVTAEECAVFGNEGGDWVDCLFGQETLDYNSDADPLFCDMLNGDFHLCENSYCHFANNVPEVQIGAHEVQCDACDSPVETKSWGNIKAMYR